MASSPEVQGMAIVLMGVSGAGKSTIGEMLGKSMSCTFLDADDFHPEPNKEKMRKGIPLSEEDRIPWLEMLRDALKEKIMVMGETVILGCSALRKHYRDILRSADPSYRPGIYKCAVKFVLLEVGEGELAARLARRAMEGKHFMSAALLSSQLALLEVDDECEGILKIDATLSPPGPEAVSFAAFQTNNSKSDNLTYAVCKDAPFAHRVPLSSPLGSDHTMEFLCRSWSPSSLNFHQILTSQNLMLPNSTIGGSEEASDYEGKEEEKTYQRQILCNRYADNTLHEPWGWLKGKTLISKFKLYRERKKQEVRLQTANLDAALSLTQLAAAIAGLTSNMPDTSIVPEQSPVLAYDQDNMNDVVASAAALMTTVCAEVAESLGALRSRVAGAVKSGLATRTPV